VRLTDGAGIVEGDHGRMSKKKLGRTGYYCSFECKREY